MTDAHAQPRPQARPETAARPLRSERWHLVVLDDPNRMTYAVMVLRRVLSLDEATARRHVLAIHETGRAIVWTGNREQAEAYMFALQSWHLTALIQPDEAG